LSPVELTQAFLERIERLNPLLNAYITISGELALKQARDAENEVAHGQYRGPLHGIPVSLKDLIATEGVLTTGATAAFADWIPSEDAVVWRRLRDSGAILLGKTNLDEIASGFATVNPFFGPARNPWNTARITGGSSGGSGAAVIAGLCMASIGSDTNGSIRVPSSLCGIVGLKPTYGLVSTKGGLFLSWTSDHFGPMANTVEDAALVLNAIAGHELGDPLSAEGEPEDYAFGLNKGIAELRLGIPTNYFWDFDITSNDGSTRQGLDAEVAQSVREAIEVMKGMGAEVVEIEIGGLDNTGRDLINGIEMAVERAAFFERLPPERWELFSQRYRDGARRGFEITAAEYLAAIRRAQAVGTAIEGALEKCDALIVPTTPIVAPLISDVQASMSASPGATGVPGMSPMAGIGRYTAPFNRSGHPALSIPCGFHSSGLPIGLMIVTKHFDETTALQVGHAFERSTSWHQNRPDL
jgi:aspartyl-tRNA(Asn)/glutamyl-tRNA(Gln) amidotransferase subunit A